MVWCGVVWCGVVWCGVVWCGVVWCGTVWCGVVWCGVVWCGVVWCGVVWCGVVWCGVVWCGVVWCGVVWCAEGADTRRQWPGCLPKGTGKREGCVSSACAVCKCVVIGGKRGVGETWVSRSKRCCHPRSSRCTPSLSACWCRRSSCNTHAIVLLTHAIVLLGPRRAFSNVSRTLVWAYHTLMDSSMTLRMNSVPGVWGPEHSMWARCMEGVCKAAATAPLQPAPTTGGAPIQPVFPPFDLATLLAASEPAPTHGTGASRCTGGASFRAALHRGGTWCLAPCSGGRTGAPGQSPCGCCPCGAP